MVENKSMFGASKSSISYILLPYTLISLVFSTSAAEMGSLMLPKLWELF